MYRFTNTLVKTSILASLFAASGVAGANEYREERRQEHRKEQRQDYREHKRHHRHKPDLIVITPRKRTYHHIHVYRPYGHPYYGYGHYHHDHDAMKWLAFTAITLKLLDNLNEQAQREHEAAQVKATTAPVGQSITWHSEDASGSVVATKEGTDNTGQTCREFQQTVTIGGETEQAYGTACLQQDGNWKIID